MSENQREVRALEAIIASQVLRKRDPWNLDDLPELTNAQRAAMNDLPTDLVELLWAEVEAEVEDESVDEECTIEETCTIDEEEFVGMNRAEEMTDETRNALDEARKEVIEWMKKRKEQDGANS